MDKHVVFIGGINGAGKSTLIQRLKESADVLAGKQKRALIAVGEARGIPYENIPAHFDDLIEPAAKLIADELSQSCCRVMLVDCHYAFKLQASLANSLAVGSVGASREEPFIQALHERFIQILADRFTLAFGLLTVDPAVACQRVRMREKNEGDRNADVISLSKYQEAERMFFTRIVDRWRIPEHLQWELDTSGELDTVFIGFRGNVICCSPLFNR